MEHSEDFRGGVPCRRTVDDCDRINQSRVVAELHGEELVAVYTISDLDSRVLANPEDWPERMYHEAVAAVEATKAAMLDAKRRKAGFDTGGRVG